MLFGHIMIGIDFMKPSVQAAEYALSRFRPARVTLLHVMEKIANDDPQGRTAHALTRLRKTATALGVPHAELRVGAGVVHQELVAAAHDGAADLLCIGRSSSDGAPKTLPNGYAQFAFDAKLSLLTVPQHVVPGGVHAAWRGINSMGRVLSVARALADQWNEELSALCYLAEDEWTRNSIDGIEQQQLAYVLKQAEVAGVGLLKVNSLRDWRTAALGVTAYADRYGSGLIVCDAHIAHIMAALTAASEEERWALGRVRSRCPMLILARGRYPHLMSYSRPSRATTTTIAATAPTGGSAA